MNKLSIVDSVAQEIQHKVDNKIVCDWTHLHFNLSANKDYYECLTTDVDIKIIGDFASDVLCKLKTQSYVWVEIGKKNDIYIIIELNGYYAFIFIEENFELANYHISMSVNNFNTFEEAVAKIQFFEEDDEEELSDEEDDYDEEEFSDDYDDY
jgi:hypothetical protein